MGNAWTANYLKITGDVAVDLRSNIAAEAPAKIVYERLISFTQSQGSKQALQFLMTREITHMRAFTAALDIWKNRNFQLALFNRLRTWWISSLMHPQVRASTAKAISWGRGITVMVWFRSNRK